MVTKLNYLNIKQGMRMIASGTAFEFTRVAKMALQIKRGCLQKASVQAS